MRRNKWFSVSCGLLLALLLSAPLRAQTPVAGKNKVTIRGQQQDVYFYSATGARLNRKVLFAPGDGGWRGWAITVAQTMASWGYDVCGLDTKTYLTSFTGKTTLKDSEVASDFRDVADWMTNRSGEHVTLVGWSAGAGLAVLAAADGENKKTFSGLVTFGLGDENVLGWRWIDNLTYVTKAKPNEPTFHAMNYMANIAPLPIYVIQASGDEDTPLAEANSLFNTARQPKRFALVQAQNHRFDGNQPEFFGQLREALQWIK